MGRTEFIAHKAVPIIMNSALTHLPFAATHIVQHLMFDVEMNEFFIYFSQKSICLMYLECLIVLLTAYCLHIL